MYESMFNRIIALLCHNEFITRRMSRGSILPVYGISMNMGKWPKYESRYCLQWNKDASLKKWIQQVAGDDISFLQILQM
jgi:hypothetical protein